MSKTSSCSLCRDGWIRVRSNGRVVHPMDDLVESQDCHSEACADPPSITQLAQVQTWLMSHGNDMPAWLDGATVRLIDELNLVGEESSADALRAWRLRGELRRLETRVLMLHGPHIAGLIELEHLEAIECELAKLIAHVQTRKTDKRSG